MAAAHAQTVLYGTTYKGGVGSKAGSIYHYDSVNNTQQLDYSFPYQSGYTYPAELSVVSDKIYGITSYGGAYNKGMLFIFDPSTSAFTTKYDFNTDFYNPVGGLTLYNGKLYGMTNGGGAYGVGAIFMYDPASNTATKKKDLNTTVTGSKPTGKLLVYKNKLYGNTRYAFYNSIIEYNPANNDLIATFFGPGQHGYADNRLCEYNNMLYGAGDESIFKYDPVSKTITETFVPSDIRELNGPLVSYNSKFYATTFQDGSYSSGGVIEFDPSTNTFTRRYDFTSGANGKNPTAPFCKYGDKLYSVTREGGIKNAGILFEYDPTTNNVIVKTNFTGGGMALNLMREWLFILRKL